MHTTLLSVRAAATVADRSLNRNLKDSARDGYRAWQKRGRVTFSKLATVWDDLAHSAGDPAVLKAPT